MARTGKCKSRPAAREMALSPIGRALFDQVPIGLVVVDRSLHAAYCNAAARRILGPLEDVGSAADIAARLAAGAVDAAAPDWRAELEQSLDDSREHRYESFRFIGEGGLTYTLDLGVLPLHAENAGEGGGAPTGLLITIQDMTWMQDLQERLAASENMAAVGRLAARVAHELNNPLDGTLRYINLCARLLAGVPAKKALCYLDHARQGLTRMARIVTELLEFSRSTPMLTENGNINWIVQEALQAMSEHADAHRVVVAAGFHDDKVMPSIESTRLFQVCCNLIKNAIDAMPDGGFLTITTGVVDDEVIVRFEDTGVGLPENAERIFEPFYTTKAGGQGTGLGLAICKDYVEQFQGRITAERGQEKGAVFTVRIPVSSCGCPTLLRVGDGR